MIIGSVYIATGLDNCENHQLLKSELEEFGIEVTFDWVKAGAVDQDNDSPLIERAHDDINGVIKADVLIVLHPGNPPTYTSSGRGMHTELGAALATETPVLLVSPTGFGDLKDPKATQAKCVFYYHRLVTRLRATPDNYDDVAYAVKCMIESLGSFQRMVDQYSEMDGAF